ncbi:hypothetical protein EXIGLDRAFT_729009 [Exidia glandulosa HHB12029]|uniref:Uncharacterized protein n=1 Tax=Exidia glandulosa HHB12029 TaxID=1314781 RepID=A0A165CT68_EXIGL|nr:hypothetical protein EXIGLDRAFT_729009 [Exidia glandulosa HHB12029]
MLLLALLFVLRPFEPGMLASRISGDGSGAGGARETLQDSLDQGCAASRPEAAVLSTCGSM